MIEIAMVVCSLSSPFNCKDVRLNFEGDHVTTQQCIMSGQFAMAEWSGEHPNWQIKRWSCAIAGQFAKI